MVGHWRQRPLVGGAASICLHHFHQQCMFLCQVFSFFFILVLKQNGLCDRVTTRHKLRRAFTASCPFCLDGWGNDQQVQGCRKHSRHWPLLRGISLQLQKWNQPMTYKRLVTFILAWWGPLTWMRQAQSFSEGSRSSRLLQRARRRKCRPPGSRCSTLGLQDNR